MRLCAGAPKQKPSPTIVFATSRRIGLIRRNELEDKTVIRQHRSRGLWLTVLALGGLVAITSYPPAEASHTVETPAPKVEAAPPVRAMTSDLVQTAETETGPASDAACSKVRKRLWVDGEGWIVRRVSICR